MPTIILDDLSTKKSRDPIRLECNHCHGVFEKPKNKVQAVIKRSKPTVCDYRYCSEHCRSMGEGYIVKCDCAQCGKPIVAQKRFGKRAKSTRRFCDRSCACTYNTTHKSVGTRRSKLEAWLETQITAAYPTLEVRYSRKDAINSELDIYIPSLKLAFELNGIFHYEPIYGADKLKQIQNNDGRKYQACIEREIELCIIDSSKLINFNEKKAQPYWDIVKRIIDGKLVGPSEFESEQNAPETIVLPSYTMDRGRA